MKGLDGGWFDGSLHFTTGFNVPFNQLWDFMWFMWICHDLLFKLVVSKEQCYPLKIFQMNWWINKLQSKPIFSESKFGDTESECQGLQAYTRRSSKHVWNRVSFLKIFPLSGFGYDLSLGHTLCSTRLKIGKTNAEFTEPVPISNDQVGTKWGRRSNKTGDILKRPQKWM